MYMTCEFLNDSNKGELSLIKDKLALPYSLVFELTTFPPYFLTDNWAPDTYTKNWNF